jgi:hypothetical protein
MSTATTTTEFIPGQTAAHKLFLRGSQHTYGDFRDDLLRDGFAVIKGAVPRKKADQYADQMYTWLENLYV